MNSSLSTLVENLKSSGLENFKYTKEEFKDLTELITRKGIYPYTFMDSFQKFEVDSDTLQPSNFKNDLTGEEITDNDYYLKIYNKLYIKTLREYHDLYLKTDVLLLSDVFETFVKFGW